MGAWDKMRGGIKQWEGRNYEREGAMKGGNYMTERMGQNYEWEIL